MAKRGAKSKLTVERRKIILDAISSGLTFKDSCASVGISVSTFRYWCEAHNDFNKEVEEAKVKHLSSLMDILQFPIEVYRNAMQKYREGQMTEAGLEDIRTTMKLAVDNAKWQAARIHGIIEKQYIETAEAQKDPYTIMNEAIDSGGKPSEDD